MLQMLSNSEQSMQSLVIVEHDNHKMDDATRHALSAVALLQIKTTLLVVGHNCHKVAIDASFLSGVDEVWLVDNICYAQQLAENISALIVKLGAEFTHILVPSTIYGKDLLPRVAAKLDVGQISDVTKIITHDTFEHPIYAGNAIETVRVLDSKKLLSIRTTAFAMAALNENAAPIKEWNYTFNALKTRKIDHKPIVSTRPLLPSAKIVVSGGRGLQSAEKFNLIEQLADKLGAAVGASRAAVDAGFISNSHQVGQTGQIIAPDLYIAIGISGAVQHIAGMKEAKIIVAINQDEHAPIFQIAHYGLVGDLFEIVPQLIEMVDLYRTQTISCY